MFSQIDRQTLGKVRGLPLEVDRAYRKSYNV